MEEDKLYLVKILKDEQLDVCELVDDEYISINQLDCYQPDEVVVIEPDKELYHKVWNFYGTEILIRIHFYHSNWIYLGAYTTEGESFCDITVNLEDFAIGHVCNLGFINTNNCQKLDTWLIDNNLAVHTGTHRQPGFCSYPLMALNYTILYQLDPEAFSKAYFTY